MVGETNESGGSLALTLYRGLGLVAFVLGVLSTGWLVLMAGQWAMPWSSLAITAPPPGEVAAMAPSMVSAPVLEAARR